MLLSTRVSFAAEFMDGSRKLSEERESFVADEVYPYEPSPYDSDTEEIDLDEFVKTLSHDVNQWDTYRLESFDVEKMADGFFGDIFKVKFHRQGGMEQSLYSVPEILFGTISTCERHYYGPFGHELLHRNLYLPRSTKCYLLDNRTE